MPVGKLFGHAQVAATAMSLGFFRRWIAAVWGRVRVGGCRGRGRGVCVLSVVFILLLEQRYCLACFPI